MESTSNQKLVANSNIAQATAGKKKVGYVIVAIVYVDSRELLWQF